MDVCTGTLDLKKKSSVPALWYEELDQGYELVPSDFMTCILEAPWMGTDLLKGFESLYALTSFLIV